MKQITLENLEIIEGGDFLDGLCGGFLGAEAGVTLAILAVEIGWIAAIPGLNVAAAGVAVAALGTCAVASVL